MYITDLLRKLNTSQTLIRFSNITNTAIKLQTYS